jgi:hypothetical protein
MEYDEKVDVHCDNCGGVFEYLTGFGSFSIDEEAPSSSHQTRHINGAIWSEPSAVSVSPERTGYGGSCGRVCACLCCFGIAFPFLLYILFFLEVLIGLF